MKYAIVNQGVVSVLRKPKKESELVDEVLYGMKVEILEEPFPKWYYIKTHYGYEGYLHETSLVTVEEKVLAWEKAEKKVVLHPYIDVLAIPKVQGYNMISLTRGALIAVVAKANLDGFVKIMLWDGREGYVKEKFLGEYIKTWSPEEEETLRQKIVETALSYMGTQYRWGGKSPLGIDCSGLCAIAYMLNGVIIYRDASIMEGFPIHEINYNDKKPGDLIFYKGHIVMYIGDDKIVHSTSKNGSDGVVINSLNAKDDDFRSDLPELYRMTGSLFY
jgi:cell wall-associated NlpC family hydrolase